MEMTLEGSNSAETFPPRVSNMRIRRGKTCEAPSRLVVNFCSFGRDHDSNRYRTSTLRKDEVNSVLTIQHGQYFRCTSNASVRLCVQLIQ